MDANIKVNDYISIFNSVSKLETIGGKIEDENKALRFI